MKEFTNSIIYTLLCILFLSSGIAAAQVIEGEVVGIVDGDTIRILSSDKQRIKVRLSGIDAPEKGQPFGLASKLSLSSLIYRQYVRLDWDHQKYSYDRIVGKVWLQNRDINLEQVRRGMAWHYKSYADEQSAEDRRQYAESQNRAKAGRKGLWNDASPIPPWQWRKREWERRKSQNAFSNDSDKKTTPVRQ